MKVASPVLNAGDEETDMRQLKHCALSLRNSTQYPSAVPIIPLPGISLSDFASRHAVEWFHISREKLCYRSQFPPPSQVAITVVYRYPAWAGATISWSRPMSRPAVPIITLLSTTLTDLRLDRHQN